MIQLFHELSQQCSRITTERYSTSFSSAIKLLHPDLRSPIYNIYGFVRFTDEIVDSFHEYDKQALLDAFKKETYAAIENRISLNPILHSFQMTVNKYQVDPALIEAFFHSMECDLKKTAYDRIGYEKYIYGSSQVVGLMCLYVFCEGNREQYKQLESYAAALGAAFQKVNFLRDARTDYYHLKRTYFPGVDFKNFTSSMKKKIEEDISADFKNAYKGIVLLPVKSRFGVYVAYKYYLSLFRKITRAHPSVLMQGRIRIPDFLKGLILVRAGLRSHLNIF